MMLKLIPNIQILIIYEVKNYYVSSSITGSTLIPSIISVIAPWNITLGNIAHYGTPYFNTSSGFFTLENTPNIFNYNLRHQLVTSGSSTGNFGYLHLPGDGRGYLKLYYF
jgi:hypothetical protein